MNRRQLLTGLTAFIAAPALVRAASLDALPRGVPLYPLHPDEWQIATFSVWNAAIQQWSKEVPLYRVSDLRRALSGLHIGEA